MKKFYLNNQVILVGLREEILAEILEEKEIAFALSCDADEFFK
jgi:hypothetical protein